MQLRRFISALPEEVAQEVLEKMDVQESSEVQELLGYQDETARTNHDSQRVCSA